jgi:hypothetical protein
MLLNEKEIIWSLKSIAGIDGVMMESNIVGKMHPQKGELNFVSPDF